jgi:hypothetical protein
VADTVRWPRTCPAGQFPIPNARAPFPAFITHNPMEVPMLAISNPVSRAIHYRLSAIHCALVGPILFKQPKRTLSRRFPSVARACPPHESLRSRSRIRAHRTNPAPISSFGLSPFRVFAIEVPSGCILHSSLIILHSEMGEPVGRLPQLISGGYTLPTEMGPFPVPNS